MCLEGEGTSFRMKTRLGKAEQGKDNVWSYLDIVVSYDTASLIKRDRGFLPGHTDNVSISSLGYVFYFLPSQSYSVEKRDFQLIWEQECQPHLWVSSRVLNTARTITLSAPFCDGFVFRLFFCSDSGAEALCLPVTLQFDSSLTLPCCFQEWILLLLQGNFKVLLVVKFNSIYFWHMFPTSETTGYCFTFLSNFVSLKLYDSSSLSRFLLPSIIVLVICIHIYMASLTDWNRGSGRNTYNCCYPGDK